MSIPNQPLWEEASTEFTQRCAFVAVWGPESGGKTTFALSAPGPTALIHAAEKINGVTQPWVRTGKRIRLHNFGFVASTDEEETATRARVTWAATKSCYLDAMDKWAKSVVIDVEPDAYALRRFAKFGTLTPKGDTRDLYASINFDWRQLLKSKFRAQTETRQCNLITIHTATDEYRDVVKIAQSGPKKGQQIKVSERTGRQRMQGHKDIKYWADVVLWVYKDIMGDGEYHVRIDKGWWNGAVEGVDLSDTTMKDLGYQPSSVTGSHITFASVMGFITETNEKEWA